MLPSVFAAVGAVSFRIGPGWAILMSEHPSAIAANSLSTRTWLIAVLVLQADASGSKADMTERLRLLCANESLCRPAANRGALNGGVVLSPTMSPAGNSNDCPVLCSCAEAGIQCHPQACRCCKFACGNPAGVSTYDAVAVKSFRKAVLSATRSPGYAPSNNFPPDSPFLGDMADIALPPSMVRMRALCHLKAVFLSCSSVCELLAGELPR